MLVVLGLMAMVFAIPVLFPDTDIGRTMRRWMVEMPARRLNRVSSGRIAFYAFLAALGLMLVGLFEVEGLRLFGMLLPDTLVWFAMFDVGVFIDALLITGAILASNGLRAARAQVSAAPRQIVAVMKRLTARAGRARRSQVRPRPPSAKDDDGGPAWAQPPYRAFSMA